MASGLLTLAGFKEAGALQRVLTAWEGLDVPQVSRSVSTECFVCCVLLGVPICIYVSKY